MTQSMTYNGHAKAILTLGLPIIGSHVAQIAITTTDTVMMGWYGVEELAGLVLAGSMFFVIFLVGAGFSFAVLPMVANASEVGDDVKVRHITRMGLWASALYALLLVPFMWWSKPWLLALGQEDVTAQFAQDYLRIAGFGLFPGLFVMVMKNYLAALERTQFVLWLTVLSAVLNGFLNYALVFGNWGAPELGVRGAAIASVAIVSLSFPILVLYAIRVVPEHVLFQRIWAIDTDALMHVFKLGWPIGLTNLAETGLFTATAIMVGWVGTHELAAHGIALQWAGLTFMVHLGLSNAATVRVGRAIGRGDMIGLKRGGVMVTAMSLGFAFMIVAIFVTWPEVLIGVFIDHTDDARDQIIIVGVGLLAMAALFQIADGVQVIGLGLLRGAQDTRVPMIYAGISYWVIGIPAGYVIGFIWGYGAVGIWMGLVFGLSVAAILLSVRFWTRLKRNEFH
ncbi:MATE family efflux transporter [Amylibacter sp. SFDW26]|uniref:MATE family efflux transporter n=1 Tax=Amylibacter sp. SFDW26 TaxID=2652722 RepID=UPI001261C470|nr:MATE family efflux transporter [Amylibacter sp. SFDW26]KAB7610490.1 MATE family efflux transporter [Amylibacter sp. SFDW26]